MIDVKIRTEDYQRVKGYPYIKDMSKATLTWFYPTANPLVLVEKMKGAAFLYIFENKEEMDAFIEKVLKSAEENK